MFNYLHSAFQLYKKYIQVLAILLGILLVAVFNNIGAEATAFHKNNALTQFLLGSPISQQPLSDNNRLELNKPISRQLKGKESHSYQIDLIEKQYVQVLIEQKGVDVEVQLIDPKGKTIVTTDNPFGERGIEDLEAIINLSGSYQIKLVNYNNQIGGYEIQLKQLRNASLKDKTRMPERLLAEEILTTAHNLFREQKFPLALEHYEKALLHCQAAENKALEADALNDIGLIYKQLEDNSKALEYYEKVLTIASSLSDPVAKGVLEAGSENNIGEIYYEQGNYQQAFDKFKKASDIGKAVKVDAQIARPLSNLANCYMIFDDFKQAIDLYNEALLIHEKQGELGSQIVVLGNLGSANYYLKNFPEAEKFFQQALILNKISDIKKGYTLRNLGVLYSKYTKQGENSKALETLQKSLEIFQAFGKNAELGYTLVLIGQLYKKKDNSQALEYLNKGLSLLQSSDETTAWTAYALYELADVKFQMGNFKEAQKDIEGAIKLTTFIRSNVISHGFREAYSKVLRNGYELYISLLMKQHQENPNSGYDIQAFRVSEQARAKSFLELLLESHADIKQGIAQELLDKEQTLGQQLSRQQNLLFKLLGTNSKASTEIGQIKVEQQKTLRELRELLVEIKKQSPNYAALVELQPLELDELQKQILDPESLLLEYFLGDNESYLWAITQTTMTSYRLPSRSKIETVALQTYKLLSTYKDDQGKAYWPAAAKLSQMILPNPEQFQQKRLIIVADGALQYIPFGALPFISSEAKPYKRNNLYTPLIEKNEVINLPSASISVLLRQQENNKKTLTQKTLIIADPVFKQKGGRVIQSTVKNTVSQSSDSENDRHSLVRGENLNPLPSSKSEADAIAQLIPANECKLLLGFEANKKSFLAENLSQYRFIQFITHGLIDDQNPELSGLFLSLVDKTGEPQDGFLALHEIYNFKLQADLIVLSACQSALGKDLKGEGIIGLTRGFMCAGTPRVIASLWNVDDSATATLMGNFYKKMLQEHKTPAQALRLAQLEMYKNERFQSPYFWAAFVLQGQWN